MFKDSDFLRVIFRRSIFLLLFKVLSIFLGFVFTIFITRTLSVDEAGTYLLVFAIVSVLGVMCRLGLDQTIVRFVAISEDEKDSNLSFLILFNCLFFVVLILSLIHI